MGYASKEEIKSIKEYLNIQNKEEFNDKYISNYVNKNSGAVLKSKINSASCIFLNEETNECDIYNVRPLQCRTYPFWPRVMSSCNDWNNEVRLPGRSSNLDDDDEDNNNYWSVDKGGCEGMKYIPNKDGSVIIDDIAHNKDNDEDSDGVDCSKAFDIVEEMRRYDKI